MRGVKGKFAQVCHGKKGPLSRLKKGDWLIYYSPKVQFHGSSERCQSFTAVGQVRTGEVYQFEMTPEFHPFRLDVDYVSCAEVPMATLVEELELTQSSSWGIKLRRGLLELSGGDFDLIATAMGVLTHRP